MRISDWSSDVCSSDLVRCLYAPFEGVAADAIDVTQDRVVLGEGAFDIAAADVVGPLIIQGTHLFIDSGNSAPVFGCVIEHAVAGTVECSDVQSLVRIVGMHKKIGRAHV